MTAAGGVDNQEGRRRRSTSKKYDLNLNSNSNCCNAFPKHGYGDATKMVDEVIGFQKSN